MRCKQCKIKFEKENAVYQGIYYFCRQVCCNQFNRDKAKKEKEKIQIRKTKKRVQKQNSISSLTKKADILWSKAVKIEYNYECQVDGCNSDNLNSHHLFTRSRKSTRWDIDNGICLCSGHHTLSSSFSAHKTPTEFFYWLEGLRGRDRINKIMRKSQEICKVTPELIKGHMVYLNNYIDSKGK